MQHRSIGFGPVSLLFPVAGHLRPAGSAVRTTASRSGARAHDSIPRMGAVVGRAECSTVVDVRSVSLVLPSFCALEASAVHCGAGASWTSAREEFARAKRRPRGPRSDSWVWRAQRAQAPRFVVAEPGEYPRRVEVGSNLRHLVQREARRRHRLLQADGNPFVHAIQIGEELPACYVCARSVGEPQAGRASFAHPHDAREAHDSSDWKGGVQPDNVAGAQVGVPSPDLYGLLSG